MTITWDTHAGRYAPAGINVGVGGGGARANRSARQVSPLSTSPPLR